MSWLYLLKGVKWEWSINHPSVYLPESAAAPRSPSSLSSSPSSSPLYNGFARYQQPHRFSPQFAAPATSSISGNENLPAPYSYIRYHFGGNGHFNEDLRINHFANDYPANDAFQRY